MRVYPHERAILERHAQQERYQLLELLVRLEIGHVQNGRP